MGLFYFPVLTAAPLDACETHARADGVSASVSYFGSICNAGSAGCCSSRFVFLGDKRKGKGMFLCIRKKGNPLFPILKNMHDEETNSKIMRWNNNLFERTRNSN